jgi:uncharacterized protein YbcI
MKRPQPGTTELRRCGFFFTALAHVAASERAARKVPVNGAGTPLQGSFLNDAISAEMVGLYGRVYGHGRTTASTFINQDVVVCLLQNILSDAESRLIAEGESGMVIDGRVAFQTRSEDEFTAMVERLTHRRVVAFLSANQTTPGVASELFMLEPRAAAPVVVLMEGAER